MTQVLDSSNQSTQLFGQPTDLIALRRLSLTRMRPRESIHPMAAQGSSLTALWFQISCLGPAVASLLLGELMSSKALSGVQFYSYRTLQGRTYST